MFQELLPASVFAILLVFVRIGGAMLQMPAIGESNISARARLLMALALSFVVTPVLAPSLPPEPEVVTVLFLLLVGEFFVGIFLGALGRIMMSALLVAGTAIAHMSNLANALVNSALSQQQASIVGNFLSLTALMLIFALELHHLMIAALVDSYAIFPPGALPPVGDFSDLITQTVGRAFLVGVQLSAPFLLVGMVVYLLMGLLGRLMPQVQIFFVVMPVQIGMGMLLLMIVLPAMMAWFLGAFEDTFTPFVSG